MLLAVAEHDNLEHIGQASAICVSRRREQVFDLWIDSQRQSCSFCLGAWHIQLMLKVID